MLEFSSTVLIAPLLYYFLYKMDYTRVLKEGTES